MAFHKQAELPPKYQLPSWTRISLAGRQEQVAGNTRQLPRDSSQRVMLERAVSLRENHSVRHMDSAQSQERINLLERNIAFLRSQHSDTLRQLHSELDRLKKENKELNFKLVMCRCGQRTAVAARTVMRGKLVRSKVSSLDSEQSDLTSGEDNLDELRPFLLEEEVRELKNSLQIERRRNVRLMKVIEQKMTEQKSVDHGDEDNREPMSAVDTSKNVGGRNSPLVEEYKVIIRELRMKNQQQGNELIQLKADLQDLLYSDKWTPDAYLIARGYVSETTEQNGSKTDIETRIEERLPEITKRQEKKIKEQAYKRLHESIHLPALKLHQPNPVADRYRRALSLQRNSRLTAAVLPKDSY